MSRIGKKPIAIPKGVKIDVKPGAVEIQGPDEARHATLRSHMKIVRSTADRAL